MTIRIFALVLALLTMVRGVSAQDDQVFIQIEAQPSLAQAETRLRAYAGVLGDVNGFALSGSWYAIALGPYPRDRAEALLRDLRGSGRVPSDSFLALPRDYGRQFWPVGGALARPQPVAPAPEPQPEPEPQVTAEPAPEPQPVVPDETPREARASEAALTREEREALQIALQWAGVYPYGIDGAFGRGTRAAMGDWQAANGFEVTGILTTAQRATLLRQYNAVLDGLDLQPVTEARAGITLEIPTGVVTFDRYEAPFAHYRPSGDLPVRVSLISQPGDSDTLAGLYEILQTLEVVPLDGPRARQRDSFTLEGRNDSIVSYTQARLDNGMIKGFMLVWPAGDEDRRTRVLDRMKASFATTDAVLDPGAISDAGQTVDLVSGLRIRTPKLSRSGFFVDARGDVLTTSEVVQGCGRITIEADHAAQVVASDPALGLAVLRPDQALAPAEVAQLGSYTPRLLSEVAVAGYSYGGALGAATLTFGTLADLQGLAGEAQLKRLALTALPGDAGGPVLDTGGAVLGLLLPRDETDRRLPQDVSFAANADALRGFLASAGITTRNADQRAVMAPEDLTDLAAALTVLVSCWED